MNYIRLSVMVSLINYLPNNKRLSILLLAQRQLFQSLLKIARTNTVIASTDLRHAYLGLPAWHAGRLGY